MEDQREIKYFNILKEAFLMTWNKGSMWFFGLLVFLGSLASIFNNSKISDQKNQLMESIQFFNQNHPAISASMVFVLVMLAISLYLLKIIATAALIKMSNNIAIYRQAKIKSIFSESKEFMWRIFLMELLVSIVTLVSIMVILYPISYLFTLDSKALASIFLIFGLLIVSLLILLSFYLIKYGKIFLVLGNLPIKSALESAYGLLEKNIQRSITFGIISIGLNLFFMIVLMLIVSIIVLFSFLIGFLFYLMLSISSVSASIVIASFLLFFIIFSLFSWFNAFMQSAWVLFFQQVSLRKNNHKKAKEPVLETDAIIPDPEAV